MPPPQKPKTDKKKSRVVLEGRLISGEEMLQKLKEREKAKEEKLARQMERKRKRELKEEETQKKKSTKALKKKEKQNEKEKPEQNDRVRESRLASVVYTCGVCDVRGRVDDEVRGIEWVGCDEERCLRWFHYDCLCKSEQEYVTESLSDGSEWFCKMCKPWLYDEE